ncbi:MAG: hypothetical protein E7678_02870 [Ruminococcaceae bacterium]|nr:hypothetical protein [Oscillospiraceae bacterium]
MLKNYREIYSSQNIMAKRLCFSAAIVMFNPMAVISSLNAPKNNPILLSHFTDLQLLEIEEYLKSYTEKPYVIEAEEYIYVVIPSFYPTSTSCLLLRMDIEPKAFLRFVREESDFFVLSDKITANPARMSKRLDAQRKDFLELCAEIKRTFMYMERFNLAFGDDEVVDGYCEQIVALSNFLGVPIDDFLVNNNEDGVPIKNNFALFTAFCATIMMLAKNEAIDRKINAELNFFGGSAIVTLSFKTEKHIKITNETFLWEYLASDRRMLFEYHNEKDRFFVTFQPIFMDWSYLGIKQERNVDLFENTCE